MKDNKGDRSLSSILAFGRSNINSLGNFTVTRNGDNFLFNGKVNQTLGRYDETTMSQNYDIYDFNPGDPGSREAEFLQNKGDVKEFPMMLTRSQDVTAKISRKNDDKFILDEVKWSPLLPNLQEEEDGWRNLFP